jgi:hypothetical protein
MGKLTRVGVNVIVEVKQIRSRMASTTTIKTIHITETRVALLSTMTAGGGSPRDPD